MAAINALGHLTRYYSSKGDDENALDSARKGIELSRGTDHDAALTFYEAMIKSYYRTGQIEEAQSSNEEAIALARSTKDFNKEIDLLLSLGESYMVSDMKDEALSAYRSALEGAKRLQRLKDEAYLTGRVGIVLAEQGHLDEATNYHRDAVELARQRDLPELEGEQLSMLAFVCMERRELDEGREHCQAAIEVYSGMKHTVGEENARKLLAEIDSVDVVE
jgi:tetratricopeptide (TPR) repeat protein